MANVSLAEKIAFLEDGRAFPDRPARIEAIETHFAWIFLSPGFAYKLKKPIRFGVIDFRDVEARHAYCELEVTLNRRLAAETYLRVVPLVRTGAGLAVDGEGEPVDWLVEMRRLPGGSTLAASRPGALADADLSSIAETLVRFYARTPPAPWDGRAYVDALLEFPRGQLRALESAGGADHGLSRDVLERVAACQIEFTERHRTLLEERAADGRIVDAHGDLRAEHVFLTDPVQIIDCLEFAVALRWLDAAEEVAFLALDCDRHGLDGVGARLLAAYRKLADDPLPDALLGFYRSRRALARAVLAGWRAAEGAADADVWRRRARWYLAAADDGIAAALKAASPPPPVARSE